MESGSENTKCEGSSFIPNKPLLHVHIFQGSGIAITCEFTIVLVENMDLVIGQQTGPATAKPNQLIRYIIVAYCGQTSGNMEVLPQNRGGLVFGAFAVVLGE